MVMLLTLQLAYVPFIFRGRNREIINSAKRITFNWSQTSGDPIVFENDSIMFPNGTVLKD
jgi:hypothetical protein